MEDFKHYHHVYKKYRWEYKIYRSSKLRFYNFWSEKKIEDYWFWKFIHAHHLNPKNKVINFFSVFGPKETSYIVRSPKIFFTAENVHTDIMSPLFSKFGNHCLSSVDLSLGFDYIDKPNYLRFPFWILRLIPAESNFEDVKKIVETINHPENRLNPERTRFAASISRHDRSGLREEIINFLNPIEKVDCAGEFLNNTKDLTEKFDDDKELFLKNYKFNICPENSNSNGYVSEKALEAIKAGCIPIYWGSNNHPEPEILNHEAILFYKKGEDNSELLEKIKRLNNSPEEFRKFAEIPPFKEGAAEKIWEMISELKNRIQKIVK